MDKFKPLVIELDPVTGHAYIVIRRRKYFPHFFEKLLLLDMLFWAMMLTGQKIKYITICVPGNFLIFNLSESNFITSSEWCMFCSIVNFVVGDQHFLGTHLHLSRFQDRFLCSHQNFRSIFVRLRTKS